MIHWLTDSKQSLRCVLLHSRPLSGLTFGAKELLHCWSAMPIKCSSHRFRCVRPSHSRLPRQIPINLRVYIKENWKGSIPRDELNMSSEIYLVSRNLVSVYWLWEIPTRPKRLPEVIILSVSLCVCYISADEFIVDSNLVRSASESNETGCYPGYIYLHVLSQRKRVIRYVLNEGISL